jgi:hypothetical protein
MFETMLKVDCTRKDDKPMLMSKILYLQYVESHDNCIFNTSANVHVLST